MEVVPPEDNVSRRGRLPDHCQSADSRTIVRFLGLSKADDSASCIFVLLINDEIRPGNTSHRSNKHQLMDR
jgi:hypothetical protein